LAGPVCASAGGGAPRVALSAHAKREDTVRREDTVGSGAASKPADPAGRPGPVSPAGRAAGADNSGADDSGGIGDPEFRDYVTARGRALLRTAYLLTGNLADAEDLVQAALAKTYLAWDRIEDRGALDGYVRRAMVNTHISWWRRRRVQEFPTDELPDRAVADPAGDSDLQEALRRAIDRLPHRMRAAVVLRYYEDMTEAEVAERLGVSLGTVKSTVSRAVAKLRIDAELLAD
jgi:RNA polymerase sigma-70 factor (sigma-E family)